ncbi:fused response regulator/phosphatase [Actinokineospora spheciospongiae]|uniref:fused response regulator/phosphatase n=1 Tax=Actinokineospora spheciospongiae TaxID=909613 RepID=UPI000558A2EA|nr:fused response regulator/phosphatase [Actinokineospora spheciospongiae]
MTTVNRVDPDAPARILVVDDTEANRYITGGWLRRAGHEVLEAATGRAALDTVRDEVVDLVILDVNLPDMSGFDVCEVLKGDAATAAIPVVHVSASHVEAGDRATGLTRGADAYLSEPIDPGELQATVKAALRYYRARAAAENLAGRLSRLTEAGLEINTARTFPALLAAAVRGATAVLGQPVTVLVVLPSGAHLWGCGEGPDRPVTTRAEHPDPLVPQWRATPGPPRSALDPTNTVQLVTFTDPGEQWPAAEVTAAVVHTDPEQPATCVALPAAAVTTGEERDLLIQLGQTTAVAARGLLAYTDEHDIALSLQRSLLPSRLPVVPGLTMAARYVPASSVAQVGGDFYEVTELDTGVLVAIGDVTGHSIEAATVMGEVRHALRAYAIEGHTPTEIIALLNAMVCRFHPTGLTTLCLILLDLAAETATIANAGHIPPLLIDDEHAAYLPLPGAILGIEVPRPEATTIAFPKGSTIVLMTDGLVERRAVPLDDDLETLRASMDPGEQPEAVCRRLLATFGRDKDDDIALVVLRRT